MRRGAVWGGEVDGEPHRRWPVMEELPVSRIWLWACESNDSLVVSAAILLALPVVTAIWVYWPRRAR